ncbi:MAG: ABC transporter substrate-binding protein [Pseudomonadota bacterium]
MTTTRRHFIAATAGTAGLALPSTPLWGQSRPKLVVGLQTVDLRETVIASKVLDGAPYDIEWAHLPGPAAQLSGLYAKSLDIGLAGSTSLIFEQSKTDKWDEKNPPLQIVAAWENPDPKYPPVVTAVRKGSGITSLKDLKGKRWGYNYGGYNYGQYIATLVKAGLSEKEVQASRFADAFASGTAFNRGQLDVWSGNPPAIQDSLRSGDAQILVDNRTLEVPGLTIFIARQEVLADAGKSAALSDFLARVRQHWVWYGKNIPQVEEIYVKKLQQTPERAQFSARHNYAQFASIDAELQRKLQKLADLFHEFAAIPRKIDVASELSARYNLATVGARSPA